MNQQELKVSEPPQDLEYPLVESAHSQLKKPSQPFLMMPTIASPKSSLRLLKNGEGNFHFTSLVLVDDQENTKSKVIERQVSALSKHLNHSSLSIPDSGVKSPTIKRQVSELEHLRQKISSTIRKKTTFYESAFKDDVGRIAMVSPDAAKLMKELRQSPLDTYCKV